MAMRTQGIKSLGMGLIDIQIIGLIWPSILPGCNNPTQAEPWVCSKNIVKDICHMAYPMEGSKSLKLKQLSRLNST